MFCIRKLCFASRQGTGLIFPNQDEDTVRHVREFGDVGESLGKRCLFFLTALYPESRLPGDRVKLLVKHLVFRGVRCAFDYP